MIIMTIIVNKKYIIRADSILGHGKFGAVYKAFHTMTNKPVAIKYDVSDYNVLKHEAFILNYIHKHSPNSGMVPRIIWYGLSECPDTQESAMHTTIPCLIMPYYEMSITKYIQGGNTISTDKVIQWKDQMLSILGHIHDLYVIHRDLKPDNFMIQDNKLVLIDFGLATFYVDGETGQHLPKNETPKTDMCGSPLYASIFVHQGIMATRRDDYISVGYILLYILLGGTLPWCGHNDIYRHKMQLIHSLTKYSSFDWLRDYLTTCYALEFAETVKSI
jgi:serine/threonine protein kinase